jgi:AcrR family transcriptional regulator
MRATYHHGDLPRALVASSVRLIAAHGVDGFSLRAAARDAGVNPAAVYRHFADRSELLAAVAATGFAQLTDRMAAAMGRAEGPEGRFTATGAAYVHFAQANPEFFRAMFGPHGSGAAHGGGVEPSAYGLLVGALEELAAAGLVAGPVEAATLTAWAAVHGLAVLLVDRATTPVDVDAAVGHLTRTVLRGLAGPPTTPAPPR